MDLGLAKAVVSGGASGLGLATAQRVIDAGGHVTLLDINDEQGAASAASLGERATYVNTDVANEESVQQAMAAANEFMGGITLAVNCAGIATAGRTLGREGPWPSELFSRVINVNLVGSFNVTKEAAAFMQHTNRMPMVSGAWSLALHRSPPLKARSARPPTLPQRAVSSA